MLRVSLTERKSNEEILRTTNEKWKVMCNIRERQAEFLGHVMRKRNLEHLVTMGKMEGERKRNLELL